MQQGLRQHVAQELFYVFGPHGSETSLEHHKQKHLYTKGNEAYAVGKLASMIWREEPETRCCQHRSRLQHLGTNLDNLQIETQELGQPSQML